MHNPRGSRMDMEITQKRLAPTEEAYRELQKAYDLFNERLFDSQLPGALLVMTRRKNTFGYYSPKRFANREGEVTDEIALNQSYFAVRSVEQVLSTLGHEMCHQWQEHFGSKTRRCYHDKEFATKMESLGLITSDTGYPGGKRVGEKITHYITEDGLFIKVCRELLESSFGIVWYDRFPDPYIVKPPSADDMDDDPPAEEGGEGEDPGAEGKDKPKAKRKKKAVEKFQPAAVSMPAIQSAQALASTIGLTIEEPPTPSPTGGDGEPGTAPARVLSPKVSAVLTRPASGEPQARSGNRAKYTCPSCHDNLWGKPGMAILCGKEGCKRAEFIELGMTVGLIPA